ncbi:MAG: amidase [Hyphomonadaceae bacterium]|nr:amidase [Hyphomonadaceae bacterium]
MSALAGACAWRRPAASFPASTADALGDRDAVGLAHAIRSGEVTAAEAMDAAIARTERVNPQLNFIIEKAYDYGRARAAAAPSGPFGGVPTLIKDLMPLAGMPTRYGSRAFAQNIEPRQAPYTDALLAAGLAPFGKSTTPEFGLTATTEPLLGGPTRNPWDVTRSCGGSSGGAAVAVASRAVPIAHASDGGGSVRIPASCNGLVGLKLSRRREIMSGRPQQGLSLSVNGCVSHSVRDTATWLSVTERNDAGAPLAPTGLVTGANTRRLRIVLSIADARGREPDPAVRAATESAAELCRALGHTVIEARPAIDGEQFSADFILLWAEGAAEVVQMVRQAAGPDADLTALLEPLTLDLAQHFAGQPRDSLAAALQRLQAVGAQYAAIFENADVMLTPVLASPPPPLGYISPTLGMAVGFARVLDYVGYTPLQNVSGGAAISLPLAWSPEGLPIGAHFSAPVGGERVLLELAYELEQARPWIGRRPPVNAG